MILNINKIAQRLIIPVIVLILLMVSSNINLGKDYSTGIIEADGKGYYAYLPAIFIYHDLNFGFFDTIEKEKYYNENLQYDYRSYFRGKYINKYYSGTALAMAPFFAIGHLVTVFLGYPLDGYSRYYTLFINLASIFYLALACLFLLKLLRTYNIRGIYIFLILFSIVFGTNVFYYSVIEFSMSHIYSFAFINMFIYYTKKYFNHYKIKLLPVIGLILGMVVLIRPANILIVAMVPFLAGSFLRLINGMKVIVKNIPALIISFLLFMIILSVQFAIYKIQTGRFWIYSYGDEGFNFFSPQIINTLFSYKKGLFLYTPLLAISLAGGYYLFKKSRYTFFTLLGGLFLITYVFSSWWMWYYGGSFSSRVFIEYFAFFAILLGIALNNIKLRWVRRAYIIILIILTIGCQIQTYQYRYNIIHWSDMTQEKYWEVFMRADLLLKK